MRRLEYSRADTNVFRAVVHNVLLRSDCFLGDRSWSDERWFGAHGRSKTPSEKNWVSLPAIQDDAVSSHLRGYRTGWIPGWNDRVVLDIDEVDDGIDGLLDCDDIMNSVCGVSATVKGYHFILRAPVEKDFAPPMNFNVEGCKGQIIYKTRQCVIYDHAAVLKGIMAEGRSQVSAEFLHSISSKPERKPVKSARFDPDAPFRQSDSWRERPSYSVAGHLNTIAGAAEATRTDTLMSEGTIAMLKGASSDDLMDACIRNGLVKQYGADQMVRQIGNIETFVNEIRRGEDGERQEDGNR